MQSLDQMVKNILAYVAVDVGESKDWYLDANIEATQLAEKYNTTTKKICGIIAATSKQMMWERHIQVVDKFLYHWNIGDNVMDIKIFITYADRQLCLNILESSVYVSPLNFLSGNKIRNFYLNLAYPTTEKGVTCDRHAVSVALNVRGTDTNKFDGHPLGYYIGTGNKPTERYNLISLAYKIVAKKLQLLPHEVQAIAWQNYRIIHNLA